MLPVEPHYLEDIAEGRQLWAGVDPPPPVSADAPMMADGQPMRWFRATADYLAPHHLRTDEYSSNDPQTYSWSALEPKWDSQDPYEVMCLSKEASRDEIRDRFFELGRKYHSDVQRGEKKYGRALRKAYEAILAEKDAVDPLNWPGDRPHTYYEAWAKPEQKVFRKMFESRWIAITAFRQAELLRKFDESEQNSVLDLQFITAREWMVMLGDKLSAEEQATWNHFFNMWKTVFAQNKRYAANRDAWWSRNNVSRVDTRYGADNVYLERRRNVDADQVAQNIAIWEGFFFDIVGPTVRDNAGHLTAMRAKNPDMYFRTGANTGNIYCLAFEAGQAAFPSDGKVRGPELARRLAPAAASV